MKLYRFSEPDYQNVVDDLVNRSNMDLFTQDETVQKILKDVNSSCGNVHNFNTINDFDLVKKYSIYLDGIITDYPDILMKNT